MSSIAFLNILFFSPFLPFPLEGYIEYFVNKTQNFALELPYAIAICIFKFASFCYRRMLVRFGFAPPYFQTFFFSYNARNVF